MSTLVHIESAMAELPPQDQWSLLSWLQSRLVAVPPPKGTPEALNIFRQLQAEVRLTKAGAKARRDALTDVRR